MQRLFSTRDLSKLMIVFLPILFLFGNYTFILGMETNVLQEDWEAGVCSWYADNGL
jgi:hypothetical protein